MASEELTKSGDRQQYAAEPHKGDPDSGVAPKVTLLWMTPDPLGAMAAFSAIYSGRVVRSLREITDDDRYQALADVQQTHLQAPLEVIKLHFLLEGVDRAFTHQLVRQRTAVYGQESLRFAVVGDLLDATTLPPSLQGTVRDEGCPDCAQAVPFIFKSCTNPYHKEISAAQLQRRAWDRAIRAIDEAYHQLAESGMPAEEARGLLPQATATRIHYITDLRNLKDHAGNRLCTQAQFHWRDVFSQIVRQVADYPVGRVGGEVPAGIAWSFKALAESGLFRPVCYQLGHCPFQASFDRACSIRERVQDFAKQGVPSNQWQDEDHRTGVAPINPAEWLYDPTAARL